MSRVGTGGLRQDGFDGPGDGGSEQLPPRAGDQLRFGGPGRKGLRPGRAGGFQDVQFPEEPPGGRVLDASPCVGADRPQERPGQGVARGDGAPDAAEW